MAVSVNLGVSFGPHGAKPILPGVGHVLDMHFSVARWLLESEAAVYRINPSWLMVRSQPSRVFRRDADVKKQ